MNRICWWLAGKLSRTLQPEEQDALHGDFAELGMSGFRALGELLGLFARRQAARAGTATIGAIGVAIVTAISAILLASVMWLFPFMLVLLILSRLCDFAVRHFGKKQKEWQNSVKAVPARVLWSETRRRPVGYWVWTIGLFVLLLYTLSHRETMVYPSSHIELLQAILQMMMFVLVVSGLINFAARRFGKKQKWGDLVTAIPGYVVRSEIRARPNLRWLTIGLTVFLLYTLKEALDMVYSRSVPLRLFWPVSILFACSCLLLFVKAIAWRDFGATYCLCDSAFSPGGKITGRIHFQREGPIEYNLISHLECLREYNSGDTCGTTKLWFSQREIPPQEFGIGSTGSRYIPIDFDLPSSALESSSKHEKGDKIVWKLHVQPARRWLSRSEGRLHVPYADCFQIPVFRRQ